MPAAANLDLTLLIKMMGMTQSDNDNQALVALRKANGFLARAGVSWEEILTAKVKVISDPFAGEPSRPRATTSTTSPDDSWRSGFGPTTPPPRPPQPGRAWIWSAVTSTWCKPVGPGPAWVFHDDLGWERPPNLIGSEAQWDDRRGWHIPQPALQQNPNATVRFTKRAGQWILKSDQPLVVSLRATIKRADGQTASERVGTLIHQDATGYYYNIEGKTNFTPLSGLTI